MGCGIRDDALRAGQWRCIARMSILSYRYSDRVIKTPTTRVNNIIIVLNNAPWLRNRRQRSRRQSTAVISGLWRFVAALLHGTGTSSRGSQRAPSTLAAHSPDAGQKLLCGAPRRLLIARLFRSCTRRRCERCRDDSQFTSCAGASAVIGQWDCTIIIS